jgi:hypothetical protein
VADPIPYAKTVEEAARHLGTAREHVLAAALRSGLALALAAAREDERERAEGLWRNAEGSEALLAMLRDADTDTLLRIETEGGRRFEVSHDCLVAAALRAPPAPATGDGTTTYAYTFARITDDAGRAVWRGGAETEEEDNFTELHIGAANFGEGTRLVVTEPFREMRPMPPPDAGGLAGWRVGQEPVLAPTRAENAAIGQTRRQGEEATPPPEETATVTTPDASGRRLPCDDCERNEGTDEETGRVRCRTDRFIGLVDAVNAAPCCFGYTPRRNPAEAPAARACRVCGCTEDRACDVGGRGRHWVEADLRSACVGEEGGR